MLLVKVLSSVFVMAFLSATVYASSTEATKKACQHATEETCGADTKCGWMTDKCSEKKDHGKMHHGKMDHGKMHHGSAKADAGKAAPGQETAPSKEGQK